SKSGVHYGRIGSTPITAIIWSDSEEALFFCFHLQESYERNCFLSSFCQKGLHKAESVLV
ncbi:hypothetical protein, partial [Lactobacillus sp.]|uniref:hypothetical protein n=1 Tax=Lactobacillus sp. TaxID=1591 RepID=UPI003F02DE7F